MRRNKTNTDMLENVAEIAVLFYSHPKWERFRVITDLAKNDSIETRFWVIDAALMFDRTEKRLSKLPAFTFDWMLATANFVNSLVEDGLAELADIEDERTIEAFAETAIKAAKN